MPDPSVTALLGPVAHMSGDVLSDTVCPDTCPPSNCTVTRWPAELNGTL